MAAPLRRSDHYNFISQPAQRAGLLSVLRSRKRLCGVLSAIPAASKINQPALYKHCLGSCPHEPEWSDSSTFKSISATAFKAGSPTPNLPQLRKRKGLKVLLLLSLFTIHYSLFTASAQLKKWQTGIVTDEFIFDTASFPESHSATIAETPKGLIAAWFGGTKERNPDVCIWTSRLVGGKWTAPDSVADGVVNDTLRYPTWNPVLYQIPGGKLLLFYKIGPSPSTWKGWYKTSADNGLHWSKAMALPEGILGPIKNKPVLLKNGTLISPSSTEGSGGQIVFELSKDFGKTWEKVGPINDGKNPNAIQPAILQYPNGKLQALCRSKQEVIEQTWSNDYGKTWTALKPSSLPNNSSGLDAVTLKDGRQLLVYNHVLPDSTWKSGKGPRTPLNVALTKDGKTWYAAAILEDSPISQYSYPAVIQTKDGMVHIVYTWRRKKIKYVKLNPAKLKLVEIKNGEWPAIPGYKAPVAGEVTDN